MKGKLSEGTLKAIRLVLIGIIVVSLGLVVYSEWTPKKAKVPEGTSVYEQEITFNDLNIGKEILLCEGSDYCRQVFDNYSKLVLKEFGKPDATLRGEYGNPMDRGSITSGWILGNGYEIILSFKHSNEYWKTRREKPKTTISMLKF